ncbi:uncharacterized protein LOC113277702 [Papaver somniferum]|uniref:uncharacterized protein LOC113277702 n=1 Tax=Papaver somniferum TaxID=3469 RepID=UPI000E6F69DC|nr:uncharacterized protein LOC113277702 [Papaver somniferum]
MSTFEMASINKLSYQRLIRNEGYEYDDYEEEEFERQTEKKRSWFKFKRLGSKKRTKLKIPGLRRFLRRKSRFFSSVRVSWCKVMRRLKESKSHMSDLFAGNYLLMQVNPTSFKSFNNKYNLANRGIHSFNPKYATARNFV